MKVEAEGEKACSRKSESQSKIENSEKERLAYSSTEVVIEIMDSDPEEGYTNKRKLRSSVSK